MSGNAGQVLISRVVPSIVVRLITPERATDAVAFAVVEALILIARLAEAVRVSVCVRLTLSGPTFAVVIPKPCVSSA